MITRDLVRFLRREFQLDWTGIHGAPHWARVRLNGRRLARENGANPRVLDLFAFLHDSRRENDDRDPEHGLRASKLARELNGRLFSLAREELRTLEVACRDHSDGRVRGNTTVQTCWDSDRLDLGRVGIRPHPDYLATSAARAPEFIEAAYRRSLG